MYSVVPKLAQFLLRVFNFGAVFVNVLNSASDIESSNFAVNKLIPS